MIPKIIHYCWFGGKEMPKLAKKCLKSWEKFCPDYKIMCWNEENFDINSNQYVKEAYENRKFAFVTDYVRLYALYNYGGVYMDTDVEVIKPIDEFLSNTAFSGFENKDWVPTGILASEKNFELIKILLEYYTDKSFIDAKGNFDLTSNTKTITNILLKKGLVLNNEYQSIDGFALYPSDYFCPIDSETKQKKLTKNTYTIHWFSGSWIPLKSKINSKMYGMFKMCFGDEKAKKVLAFIKNKKEKKSL